jgi:hypothetical protein
VKVWLTQVVELLICKCKALSSNCIPALSPPQKCKPLNKVWIHKKVTCCKYKGGRTLHGYNCHSGLYHIGMIWTVPWIHPAFYCLVHFRRKGTVWWEQSKKKKTGKEQQFIYWEWGKNCGSMRKVMRLAMVVVSVKEKWHFDDSSSRVESRISIGTWLNSGKHQGFTKVLIATIWRYLVPALKNSVCSGR